MRKWIYWICLLLVACQTNQKDKEPRLMHGSFIDHLQDFDAQKIIIAANFQEIIESKNEENSFPATVQLTDKCPEIHQFDIKLSSRGVTRKKHCAFPPLKFNLLKTKMSDDLEFDKYPSYKLVTHCKEDSGYKDYLIREYTCYRLLNTLTDYSLRAHLMDIDYLNPSGKDAENHKGIIIENVKDFARRMDGYVVGGKTPISKVNREHYQMIVLFQYMLGNTDWSLSQRHNIEYIQLENAEMILIPYDFDYSGIVNTHYAVPHPQLPIEHVTERLLQYRGKHTDELKGAIQLFLDKKTAIYSELNQIQEEANISLGSVQNYIDSFFDIISNPVALQESFEAAKINI